MTIPVDAILHGDALATLRTLPANSVQCVVTSPPYFGLRDYGVPGQIGLEPTPAEYVARLVDVFREVKRVLRDDGTLWLNLGDSYANDAKWGGKTAGKHALGLHGEPVGRNRRHTGLRPKNLLGIPWRVAFALQDDGWILRQDIIWHKPNAMPESVCDRPTKAHEYLFLLAKSERYFYDADAIREEQSVSSIQRWGSIEKARQRINPYSSAPDRNDYAPANGAQSLGCSVNGRNRRSVWTIATKPYKEAHFATMPPELVEPCILAGTRSGDIVLDPFFGSGTVGAVARRHSRRYIGIELNADYITMAEERIADELQPVLWTA